ncbi:hypothetical protein [Leptospira kirschneri]|uniref:hypothetical protein n=1 Tax=Leptospira kirschneri TaxID=29507 RepID=UPI00046C8445|nr:hypothetical protein [Leptospira kirschneri]
MEKIVKSLRENPKLWEEYGYGLINSKDRIAIITRLSEKNGEFFPIELMIDEKPVKISLYSRIRLYLLVKAHIKEKIEKYSIWTYDH